MSPQGRPKGEYRSPQGEGTLMSPQGRPKGEYRSPQGEGTLMSPQGRPKGRIPQCAACRLPDKPRRRGKTPGYTEYDHAPQP
jgi:16S rRNA (guanine527-N7)-methyltransferase